MDIQQAFFEAREALGAGQREVARALLVAILREDPDFVPAWLWLSGVLDDPERRRECLERVLAIEPDHAAAKQGLEVLNLQQVAEASSPIPEPEKPAPAITAKRLGDYLVSQHFITQQQLDAALREQQQESRYGRMVALGDILLRRRWLTMHALTRALELQKAERQREGISSPNRLGEYLVKQHIISDKELGEVIARQAALKRQGQNFQLGELLVLSGMVSRQQLQQAIDDHQNIFMRQLNNERG